MQICRAVAAAASVMAATVGFSGSAQAKLINCPVSFTADGSAKVRHAGPSTDTAASACQYVDPPDNNNTNKITNINAAGFFGSTNWTDNGQTQINPPNDQGGTWAIAGVDFATYDYIFVFKDGNDTNLIAFLFNEEVSSGAWTTPFSNPPFAVRNPKDVSDFTIARRLSSTTSVPEPSSIALAGLALLIGAGLTRSRRRG